MTCSTRSPENDRKPNGFHECGYDRGGYTYAPPDDRFELLSSLATMLSNSSQDHTCIGYLTAYPGRKSVMFFENSTTARDVRPGTTADRTSGRGIKSKSDRRSDETRRNITLSPTAGYGKTRSHTSRCAVYCNQWRIYGVGVKGGVVGFHHPPPLQKIYIYKNIYSETSK